MMTDAKTILQEQSLRLTDIRLHILQYIIDSNRAVGSNDLEKAFPDFDRVTVYRTIQTYLEKNILHKIPDERGGIRYALHPPVSQPAHTSHVHFSCSVCSNIYCVSTVPLPALNLPEGFTFESINLTVYGVCNLCGMKK